jgi:hypothetical protein
VAGVLPFPRPQPLSQATFPREIYLPEKGKKNARRLEGNGHFIQCEVLLLLIATLVARLAKQLAVLLLGHTLATLLNN